VQVRLEREQRRELVGYLSGEGMSNRAIAKLTDTDERTIRRDRVAGAANAAAEPVTGLDGKKYKPKPVDAKPRRGNSKLQIRVLKGTQVQLSAMASALEAAFTGMFDKTCTPDIAHHAALEMRAFIARIDKVLRMLEASR
jgi:transposase